MDHAAEDHCYRAERGIGAAPMTFREVVEECRYQRKADREVERYRSDGEEGVQNGRFPDPQNLAG